MEFILKIISWIVTSFLVGMGVYLGYILIGAIFDKLDSLENLVLRILFFTAIGGVTTAIFKALNKNEEYN